MNKLLSRAFYNIEVGDGRPLVRLIPLLIALAGIIGLYNLKIYKGLNDMQSMDNAQVARQLIRHQGFNTFFVRPYALQQIRDYRLAHGMGAEMFPDSTYPPGVPRSIPDTYNSPGYPVVLAALFKLTGVDFDESNTTTGTTHMFSGDHWIPLFNQSLIILTAGVIFFLGYRLFDERVAWMASVVFLFSDFVWKYALLATPTNLLMLLTTLLLLGFAEIHRLSEQAANGHERPFIWAWLMVPALAVLFGLICLFSLPLLILLLPLLLYLGLMRRTNFFFLPVFGGIALLMVLPWFWHWYKTCGNPLGSNLVLGLYSQTEYTGNQVYCLSTIPDYKALFAGGPAKEYNGFLWWFTRGWDLLGSSPMILLFAASILHEFRRRRVQAFRWLIVGSAFAIAATTNVAYPQPDPVSAWNLVVVLLPGMILVGSAFFFTLLDRLLTQMPLLTITIVVATLALSIAPMLLVFSNVSYAYYNYPPYLPPLISAVSRSNPGDQWITSDLPWATAWYGDRVSLWLPETPDDFTHINDDVNESSMLLFTPATLSRPVTTITTGELKDWLPYIFATQRPPGTFPLHYPSKLPADYLIWSNKGGSSEGH